jgi:hypothetical protein
VLTYVDRANGVVTRDLVSGRVLWRAAGAGTVEGLEWSTDGRRLHVLRRDRVDVLTRAGALWTGLRAPGGSVTATALVPGSHASAAAVSRGRRSEVLVLDDGGGRVLEGRGRFSSVTWAPDGRWLLIAWPDADQWVLVRSDGGAIRAVSRIADQFGSRDAPRVEGWCCAR